MVGQKRRLSQRSNSTMTSAGSENSQENEIDNSFFGFTHNVASLLDLVPKDLDGPERSIVNAQVDTMAQKIRLATQRDCYVQNFVLHRLFDPNTKFTFTDAIYASALLSTTWDMPPVDKVPLAQTRWNVSPVDSALPANFIFDLATKLRSHDLKQMPVDPLYQQLVFDLGCSLYLHIDSEDAKQASVAQLRAKALADALRSFKEKRENLDRRYNTESILKGTPKGLDVALCVLSLRPSSHSGKTTLRSDAVLKMINKAIEDLKVEISYVTSEGVVTTGPNDDISDQVRERHNGIKTHFAEAKSQGCFKSFCSMMGIFLKDTTEHPSTIAHVGFYTLQMLEYLKTEELDKSQPAPPAGGEANA